MRWRDEVAILVAVALLVGAPLGYTIGRVLG